MIFEAEIAWLSASLSLKVKVISRALHPSTFAMVSRALCAGNQPPLVPHCADWMDSRISNQNTASSRLLQFCSFSLLLHYLHTCLFIFLHFNRIPDTGNCFRQDRAGAGNIHANKSAAADSEGRAEMEMYSCLIYEEIIKLTISQI